MPEVISGPEARERPSQRRRRLIGKVVDRLVELGAGAVLIACLYVIYILVTGDAVYFPKSPDTGELLSAQSQARLVSNALLAANVILIGSILTCAVVAVRWGWVASPSWGAGVWGLMLYFLGPWSLSVSLASAGRPANEITNTLGWTFQVTGQVVLVMVLVRLVAGLVHRVLSPSVPARAAVEMTLEEEETEQRQPRRPRSLLRKCWELSLCSAELRQYCPAYIERKSCWRKGQGCLCDPLFWDRAMERAEKEQGVRVSAHARETRARMRQQTQVDMSSAAKRARCRACPIYNEHQRYKFKALVWLAYPVTAVLVWALMGYIHSGYLWFTTVLNRLVASAAFLPNRDPEIAPFMSVAVETGSIEFLVVLAVAFVVVSYLLELAEYLIFEVKI